jgi:hypothetical protein
MHLHTATTKRTVANNRGGSKAPFLDRVRTGADGHERTVVALMDGQLAATHHVGSLILCR